MCCFIREGPRVFWSVYCWSLSYGYFGVQFSCENKVSRRLTKDSILKRQVKSLLARSRGSSGNDSKSMYIRAVFLFPHILLKNSFMADVFSYWRTPIRPTILSSLFLYGQARIQVY